MINSTSASGAAQTFHRALADGRGRAGLRATADGGRVVLQKTRVCPRRSCIHRAWHGERDALHAARQNHEVGDVWHFDQRAGGGVEGADDSVRGQSRGWLIVIHVFWASLCLPGFKALS